ncbi:transposase [[Haemophilus] ducreyi]|uniref:Aromatic amino acid permease n=2 Tax=Haemophilus ducreyi TaxID=730 RepID=Q7VNA8_HAEDU|nr:aromatic amino acid transporter [[Haemophilus] ducreyi]AAP95573.1 tryptophan-specific transport protein [[Haemophilus] ducreyi 35000HP]AKO30652.1 TnaB [[Haemophilus] ducreyi]AKO32089.1 TnaB [[Haemophilus] ducreyi]AKO33545.1 TnaB [[Haemophilus] ducreyi]AKO34991.1 TnaB [[Haemophilus] ducreyi]
MQKQPSIFGGACIIAGVCVGAGMLGLPTSGAGAWTIWSIISLTLTMIVMTLSGWLLLNVYQNYDARASFNTVTKDLLGNNINIVNNLAVYFVGGILLYAYTTASGGILSNLTNSTFELGEYSNRIWSTIFVFIFSFFVWHSTRLVDRISVLLILFMAFSFAFSISGLVINIDLPTLFDQQNQQGEYAKYALAMFPIALTSFGYHHSVSSMRAYYGEEQKAKYAIASGTFIALILYLLWIISILGNLPRQQFIPIIASNGDLEILLNTVGKVVESPYVRQAINAFSMAAILSSFIGVGLGTFDFLADFFKFDNSKMGRMKSWAATFLPPLVFSLIAPLGFLKAIGYAGAVATLWTCIIPALLAYKARKGHLLVITLVLLFGVCTAIFHFLAMFEILPVFN